jgi:pimeloyl-ACP methyl ester carboxylesterase
MFTEDQASALFRAPPHQFLDVGTGEVAYRRVGTGPDVLFVHGWPVSSATYRRLLPHLVDHVTCHLIDLPGAGDSRFRDDDPLSIANHIHAVRRVVDLLALEDYAVVGHDSGGMIARHAVVGDSRLRAMGLVNTEQSQGLSWRFESFLWPRSLPGFGALLGWAVSKPAVRRNRFLLGEAFADPDLLEGEFDTFFLRPLYDNPRALRAAVRLLQSFERRFVHELGDLHARLDVPVQLVWGDLDPFFPVAWAREMVHTFPDARLTVVEGASLFVHEERPRDVVSALLPTLTGQTAER